MRLIPRPPALRLSRNRGTPDQRPAEDLVPFHKTPDPAVLAVVTVIAHHEVGALGHEDRAEIITGLVPEVEDIMLDRSELLFQQFRFLIKG